MRGGEDTHCSEGGEGVGIGGGGRKSDLIANKSQKALKNCCLSFTFQFEKETILSEDSLFMFHYVPSPLSSLKSLYYE